MTCTNARADSDSVNLGSNPSSPATANADVSGVSRPPSASEKSEIAEQTAHTGRTEAGTGWRSVHQMTDDAVRVEAAQLLRAYGKTFLERSLHAKAMRWRDLNSERVRRLISLDGDIGRREPRV